MSTANHKRFYKMIEPIPVIRKFWNMETHELNVIEFDNSLPAMSSGEYHLAMFLAAVWFGNTRRYPFDIFKARDCLDNESWKIINDWLTNPFYP